MKTKEMCEHIESLKNLMAQWYQGEIATFNGGVALLRLNLDYDAEMTYSEEDLRSMAACKAEGEKALRRGYDAACRLLSSDAEDGLCTWLTKACFALIEGDSNKVSHHLRMLRSLGADDAKMEEIESCLNPLAMKETIKAALAEELSDRYYQIDDFYDYAEDIDYQEWDMTGMETKGLLKLLATAAGNVHYQYDCLKPWAQINADITEKAQAYEGYGIKAAQKALYQKHIENAEFLLSEVIC